jgi:hypothetical protein
MIAPVAGTRLNQDVTRVLSTVTPAGSTKPALVVLAGLPGVGKTHVASRLRERTSAPVLESDAVRLLLSPERRYTRSEHRRVFAALHGAADALLTGNSPAIVDATNLSEREREPLYELAERHRARLLIVLVTAPDSVARDRLEQRTMGASNSEADAQIYEEMQWRLEEIRRPHHVIDTSGEIEPAVDTLAKEMMQQ